MMIRQTFILPLACISINGVVAQTKTPQRPNIIFILADDLGWNDLHCTGSRYYETLRSNGYRTFMAGKLTDGPKGENLSMRLARETASFIETHTKKNQKQPFLAYLSFYAVHSPIQTTEQNWRYFREKAVKENPAKEAFIIDRTLPVRQVQDNPVYAGLIKQMDDAVGKVLDKLEELGLDKNTIIVFTSDNGGVSSDDAFATGNLPLRGGKGRQWEGGLRVPILIQYPGCKNPVTTCDTPVTGTDYFPTLLDMAGIPLLPEQHRDGVSIKPLLEGKTMTPRSLCWHYPHYGNQGGEPSSIIRDGDWKLIHYYEDGRNELYNLRMDITEMEPLNVQYPEKADFLYKKLFVWLTEVNALYPVADPAYDPVKEAAYKREQQTEGKQYLETQRKQMFEPDFKPNVDWWGSATID